MKGWYRQPIFIVATVIWMSAWVRVLWTVAMEASPPRLVAYFGADGEPIPDPHDWNCHGSAFVHDGRIWQHCEKSRGEPHAASWTRFDLSAARADMLWPTEDRQKCSDRFVGAVVAAGDNGLLMSGRSGVVCHLKAEGGTEDLGFEGFGFFPCLSRNGDRIDYVYMAGEGIQHASIARDGDWVIQSFPSPAFGAQTVRSHSSDPGQATHQYQPLGCYRVNTENKNWRAVWVRFPLRAGPEKTIDLEFWVGSMDETATLTETKSVLPRAQGERDRNALVWKSNDGRLFLELDLLDRTTGAGVQTFSRLQSPLVPTINGFVRDSLPEGYSRSSNPPDYVVKDDRVEPITYANRFRARWRDEWFGAIQQPQLIFARLENDGSTQGTSSMSPVIDSFWADPGFKWLPDSHGGFWVMGSQGEAFVHLDSGLRRTDSLSLQARLRRALETDRLKRNSDFYFRMGWLKRFLFLWVLLAAPGLVLVAVGVRRFSTPNVRVRVASWIYVIFSIVGFPVSFWWLSGNL